MKRRSAVLIGIASLLGVLLLGATLERGARQPPQPPGPHQTAYWESAIERFERRDAERPPRAGSVLFLGSSSIRLWERLADDMDPLAVINRGFGGSHIHHATHFFNRIVEPYEPRGIVLYAGDNDIARTTERPPESVLADFRGFVERAEASDVRAPIYFVSIKPSPSRFMHWPRMATANRLIAEYASRHPRVTYLDVASPMLGPDGRPRAELFLEDGVHMNELGYRIWTNVISPVLLEDLGADAS